MKHIKTISLLLLICLLSTLAFTACDKKGGGGGEGIPEDLEYSGETVTFLTCGVNKEYESEIVFNTYTDDGLTQTMPDALNNAIQDRNDILLSTLGVQLKEVKIHSPNRVGGEMYQEIYRSRAAGLAEYDVVVPCLYDGAKLATQDLLLDLNAIPELDMKAEWWNQEFNKSMTFAGQLYYSIGEIGHVNKNSTAALYFNLELWNKNKMSDDFGGTPYDLVRKNKWTFDVAHEAARTISRDVNEDGMITYKDEFGWGGQDDDLWSIFHASGEKIAQPDANGMPIITIYNTRTATLMEKLQDLVQSRSYYVCANEYFGESDTPTVLVRGGFTEGRCLFFNDAIGEIINIGKEMEEHFGVVPVPKADAIQDSYHSLINPWVSTCFAIPSMVSPDRVEMIAKTLNVMGEASMTTVTTSYAEILNYMKTRDDDSKEMLNEYIIPNRSCDVGMVYKWGELDILLQKMRIYPKGSFQSHVQTQKKAAEAQMNEMIAFYKKNQKTD